MSPPKRQVGIYTAVGIVCAVAGGTFVDAYLSHGSKIAAHPKLWNSTALVATLEDAVISGTGDDEKLMYRFTVENRTDTDYSVPGNDSLTFMLRGGEKKSLKGASDLFTYTKIDSRFFPARQNVAVVLAIQLPLSKTFGPRLQSQTVIDWMCTILPGLTTFVIFDPKSHYEIDFPAGCKAPK